MFIKKTRFLSPRSFSISLRVKQGRLPLALPTQPFVAQSEFVKRDETAGIDVNLVAFLVSRAAQSKTYNHLIIELN
jgi:hypothetical protein